ncbi:glycosyltransferase family 2 protein [Pseudomonas pseudonitroreducens]|uniref:glycosyltransferase family 2 protein n=1 Tax=Pseudomonas pseudonitroreducens TaxID=2892326 RepID=UPI001F44AC91|nr:glycosyltransferase family 2 protein [Pseudomonas pseudonitroreducens]
MVKGLFKSLGRLVGRQGRQVKLTVVTVTYNAKEALEVTLKSVASQTSDDFEYIIIDGASSDGTVELVRKYPEVVTRFVSEPDEGIYHVMNKGIQLANGRWILFLNAGDTFSSAETVRALESELDEEFDFVFGDRNRISDSGESTLELSGPVQETLNREVVFHQACATKAALLKDNPYNTNYLLAADFEYIVSSWARQRRFKKISMAIANFQSGGRSAAQHVLARLEASHVIAKYHKGEHGKVRRNSFYRSLAWSNLGFAINDRLQALKAKNADLEFYVSSDNERLKLESNNSSREVTELTTCINQAFSSVVAKEPLLSATQESRRVRPLFTIVTVTFNAEALLQQTIDSVLGQKFKDFEFIVVDGASSDGTVEIIKRNAHGITHWISEPDSGIYDAMNKGIDLASGQWVNFMNAGDTFASDDVLSCMAANATEKDDVLFGDRYYVKDGRKELQLAKPVETIFERMPFGHQSTFVRCEVLQGYKFNQTYKYAADYNLLMSLYLKGHGFKYINVPVCEFLAGGQSESGLRPYLETIKILLDHTSDKEVIAKNIYFKAFRRIGMDLCEKVVEG